jgi:hypothetical protein
MSDELTELDSRLIVLLREGGFDVRHVGPACYDVTFHGELREWTVTARLTDAWIFLRSYVMRIPDALPLRSLLMKDALETNGRLLLGKLSIEGDGLVLDLEYRSEHVDGAVLSNLLGLAVKTGDAEYPRLFRIAAGDVTLSALESSFGERHPA